MAYIKSECDPRTLGDCAKECINPLNWLGGSKVRAIRKVKPLEREVRIGVNLGPITSMMPVAKKVGAAEKGGLNLFKWGKGTTTKPGGWKEGDFMLHLPDQGSAKANWAQNAGRL